MSNKGFGFELFIERWSNDFWLYGVEEEFPKSILIWFGPLHLALCKID